MVGKTGGEIMLQLMIKQYLRTNTILHLNQLTEEAIYDLANESEEEIAKNFDLLKENNYKSLPQVLQIDSNFLKNFILLGLEQKLPEGGRHRIYFKNLAVCLSQSSIPKEKAELIVRDICKKQSMQFSDGGGWLKGAYSGKYTKFYKKEVLTWLKTI